MSLINILLEKNALPDSLIRFGIRRLLKQRLSELKAGNSAQRLERLHQFIQDLKSQEIALHTAEANEQHYEVPAPFYQKILGKHLKYSCGLWEPGTQTLEASEEAMLALTCQRAQLQDGQHILELGCGWGSLTLFMAAAYPNATVTAVSNSKSQREFIMAQAKARKLINLNVLTCDMNQFHIDQQFDRVVSVEMFEHMRNIPKLMARIHGFLKPGGMLFFHIFVHKNQPYLFEVRDASDWMAKHFFTGGMMPSDSLPLYFQDHFQIEHHWRLPGWHYQKTGEAWLENAKVHKQEILNLFSEVYGEAQALKWWVYWRVFFMACAELWGYANGEEWWVSHYLFRRRDN